MMFIAYGAVQHLESRLPTDADADDTDRGSDGGWRNHRINCLKFK